MGVQLRTGTRLDWTSMADYSGTNYTIAFWARKKSGEGVANYQYVFLAGGCLAYLTLSTTTLRPGLSVTHSTGTKDSLQSSSNTQTDYWRHFALVNSDYTSTLGSSIEVYVDGVKMAASNTNGSGTASTWGSTWYIGNNSGATRSLGADLAGFGIWSRALSAGEILTLAYGAPPEEQRLGLVFCPSLSPDRSLIDLVTNTKGAIGAGTIAYCEDPPELQDSRTARIYRFAPPAAGGMSFPLVGSGGLVGLRRGLVA